MMSVEERLAWIAEYLGGALWALGECERGVDEFATLEQALEDALALIPPQHRQGGGER